MKDFKIFVNFKTYSQGTGEKALELAKICQEVSAFAVQIIPVVQAVDVFKVKQAVDIPVWMQHVDSQLQGQFTGWTNLEAVIEAGASGTLLNHSEHSIPPGTVKHVLDRVKSSILRLRPVPDGTGLRSGQEFKVQNFETMICCKTLGQMERLVKLKPNYIGYEISELIGGKVSITDYNPKAIKHAVEICGKIPLIIGAGIHKPEDLRKAKDLGSAGVLISSAIVLADSPKQKLGEILKLVV